MGFIRIKEEMVSTLNEIRQDASRIAKKTYDLKEEIRKFQSDTRLQGQAFDAARVHFSSTYYAITFKIIEACESMMTDVKTLKNIMSKEFEIPSDEDVQDELQAMLNMLKADARRLSSIISGASTGTDLTDTRNSLDLTNTQIQKHEKTIEQMIEVDDETQSTLQNTQTLITNLSSMINSIQTGYNVNSETGEYEFNNDVEGLDTDEIKDLEKKYTSAEMKKAFDPINMATGNYIYNKSFLVAEGVIPLEFEIRYNSIDRRNRSLGTGWSHNHMLGIAEYGDTVSLSLRGETTDEYIRKEGQLVNMRGYARRILTKLNSEYSYRYTDDDRSNYFFNEDGQCVKREDVYGRITEYKYEDDKLTSIDTRFGLGYRFKYENDLLKEVTDLSGRRISFEYEDDKLIKAYDECGESYCYEYDEEGRMFKVINARGTVNLVNTYDSLNRVKRQEFPDEGSVELLYLDSRRTITSVAQNGSKSEHIRDEKVRSIGTVYSNSKEEYSYDDRNLLISEKDRNENVTEYEYDDDGNLTKEITPIGDEFVSEYDKKGKQTSLILNGDVINRYEYNDRGMVISETDSLGRSIRAEYDDKNLLTKIVNEDGTQRTYEYDDRGNIIKETDECDSITVYVYDNLNRITEITDPNGNKESYEYNDRSEITRVTNAKGDVRCFEYNESGKLTKITDYDGNFETLEYNELNRMSKHVDKDGNETCYEYDKMWNISKVIDAEGKKTLYFYDKNNELMSVIDAAFGKTGYERDEKGNVIKLKEGGSHTKYEYDAADRPVHIIYGDGGEERIEYDALGNETKYIDRMGDEWKTEYNSASELICSIEPDGTKTKYTYDMRGRIISEDTEGQTTNYEYDKTGRLIRKAYPDGSKEEFGYDAKGNLIRRLAGGISFEYVYDCLDQITEIRREGDLITSYEYDKAGNVIASTDAMGNTTKFIRSKAGDILAVIDPTGHETRYEYDKCHRLMKIDQGGGRITIYERGVTGNVVAVTDALGNNERYEYDGNDLISAKIDMDGNRTEIERNIYGDITKIKYADSSEIEYRYDELRRLNEIHDSLGTTKIERDDIGRETRITDHKGRSVEYGYDRFGNLTSLIYPGGRRVDYEYDKHGRTTKVKTDDLETSFTYDDMGRLSQRRSGDLFTSYTYDRAGRLSTLTQKRGDEQIHREDYTYDANDNILSDGTSSYTYDKLGRLIKTAEASGKTCEYSYDAFGNRTSMTEGDTAITYFYNEVNQLISTSEGLSFRYDKRGNLIEKTLNGELINSYSYGVNNRLTRAKNADGETARYIYNGLGNRVSRHTEGRDTDYVLDLTKMYNNLLEADGRSFVWNEDELLFENDTPQMRDRLGSPMETGAFGVGKGNDPIGFTGYMYDDVSGTYFAQAREYMPQLGRFAGRDTLKGQIEMPHSLNEYVYCHNNPLKYRDRDGMKAEEYYDLNGLKLHRETLDNDLRSTGAQYITSWAAKNMQPSSRIIQPSQVTRNAAYVKGIARVAGPAAAAADVGYGAYQDYKKGASKSKRRHNMKVNALFAFGNAGVGIAATAIAVTVPGGGLIAVGLILGSIYVDARFRQKLKNRNSLD